jgi:6-phosphogluconate dehydrogenase (decarboxylating)
MALVRAINDILAMDENSTNSIYVHPTTNEVTLIGKIVKLSQPESIWVIIGPKGEIIDTLADKLQDKHPAIKFVHRNNFCAIV